MHELEAIKAIKEGRPLPAVEGIKLDLLVNYENRSTTVVHELVLHNRLDDLLVLMAGKTRSDLKFMCDVSLGAGSPLECLIITLVYPTNADGDYINPWSYKDLICFFIENGANTALPLLRLKQLKRMGSDEAQMAQNVIDVIEECVEARDKSSSTNHTVPELTSGEFVSPADQLSDSTFAHTSVTGDAMSGYAAHAY